jgi:hypothetical protein
MIGTFSPFYLDFEFDYDCYDTLLCLKLGYVDGISCRKIVFVAFSGVIVASLSA